MKARGSPLERAFELARSGRVARIEEIKTALKAEGYSSAEIEGPTLAKQLREIIKATRAEKSGAIPIEDLNASNDE